MTEAKWTRTGALLTAILLLAMTFSGLGVLLWSADSVSASGDNNSPEWLITSPQTVDADLVVRGNITIVDGGSLTIKDSTLQMGSGDLTGDLTITVGHGGSLILEGAEIAAYPYTYESRLTLAILIENGGEMIMRDSALTYPGHLLIDNGRLDMHSSVIRGVPDEGNETFHSPVVMGFSADVVMVNSTITDIFTGNSTGLAVHYNSTFATETALRQTVEYDINRYPASSSIDNDNLSRIFNPGSHLMVPGNEELILDGFDVGGLIFNADDYDLHLNVHYRTEVKDFTLDAIDVEYGRGGDFAPSGMELNNTWTLDDKNILQKEKVSISNFSSIDLSTMQVRIDNTNSVGIMLERVFVSIEGIAVDSYRNITFAGDSSFLAVDSVLPINHESDPEERHALVLMDSSNAYLYNVTLADPSAIGDPEGRAIEFVDRTVTVLPLEKTADDNTGGDFDNLFDIDLEYYHIPDSTNMSILMNLTGLPEGLVNVKIDLSSTTTGGEGPVLQYSNEYGLFNTTIQPVQTNINQEYQMGKFSISDLIETKFILENDKGLTVSVDFISLDLTYQPQAYIYKYAAANITNSLDHPIQGVTVEAENMVGGSQPVYLPYEGDSGVPPAAVLDQIGRSASDFNRTDSQGMVIIPLLSGIHNSSSDSHFAWKLTAKSPPDLYTIGSSSVSFGAYPYLSPDLGTDGFKPFSITGTAAQLELSDPYMVRTDDKTLLAVDVENVGDAESFAFNITFLVNGDPLTDNISVASLASGETLTLQKEYVQAVPGKLEVEAKVNSVDSVIDGVNSSADLTVNLRITSFEPTDPVTSIGHNQQLSMFYMFVNDGVVAAENVKVEIFITEQPGSEDILVYERTIALISPGSTIFREANLGNIEHSGLLGEADLNITLVINNGSFEPGGIPETDYSDNTDTRTIGYTDDRPVLSLSNLTIEGDLPLGKLVDIRFKIENTGGQSPDAARLTLYLDNGTDKIEIVNTTTSADGIPLKPDEGEVIEDKVRWRVNVPAGNYTLIGYINQAKTIDERDYSDNSNSTEITVLPLVPRIIDAAANPSVVSPGETITVSGRVVNLHDISSNVPGESVVVRVFSDGVLVAQQEAVTSGTGIYVVQILAAENMAGQIEITSTVTVGDEVATSSISATVQPSPSVTDQPLWVWLLIIGILLAIIAAFTLYVYRYSLGKMAECGECHALIPEAARRCPNCGTDFEAGTAKCSECSSWIPADSTDCPECGASFTGGAIIDVKESEYIQLMREGYEAHVDNYREKAREDLGKKYSDSKFLNWWKDHPEYVSFEDWLAKEEGKKMEKSFPCPSCGTPNVVGSKNCYRCGHEFQKKDDDEAARRVVRRDESADKPEIKTDAAPRKKVVVKRKAPKVKEGEDGAVSGTESDQAAEPSPEEKSDEAAEPKPEDKT